MNINEEYMFNIRKVNKTLKGKIENKMDLEIAKKYKDALIADYSKKISEHCQHDVCTDIGYYKIKGKEVWVTDKETADFRVIECEICHQEIYLINNEDEMWDCKIGDLIITIKSKKICKRV